LHGGDNHCQITEITRTKVKAWYISRIPKYKLQSRARFLYAQGVKGPYQGSDITSWSFDKQCAEQNKSRREFRVWSHGGACIAWTLPEEPTKSHLRRHTGPVRKAVSADDVVARGRTSSKRHEKTMDAGLLVSSTCWALTCQDPCCRHRRDDRRAQLGSSVLAKDTAKRATLPTLGMIWFAGVRRSLRARYK
jgi:hypothetical protein